LHILVVYNGDKFLKLFCSMQNVIQHIKLDCKRVESDAYMQQLAYFAVSKNDNKVSVGAT